MKRKFGLFFMVLGVLALCCSAALLLHNQQEDRQAGAASARVLPQMEQIIRENQAETTAATHPTTPSAPTEAPEQVVTLDMPREEIDGELYVGFLSMPTIDRELPILASLQMPALQIAPCRYAGSTHTDDLVIGAHNYHWHFGPISQLLPGDPVFFTDIQGLTTAYEVTGTETLMPTDLDKLLHSPADLTLFTCTYGGASRVTVRCQRCPSP